MKWHHHKVTTLVLVFAATGMVIPSLFAMIGSVFPDVLEFRLIKHRTLTHWAPLYVPILLASTVLRPGLAAFTWFLAIGCLCHIAEDALSKGGVPLLLPTSKPHGAGLYMTGTITETFVVVGILVLALGIAQARGFFHLNRFRSELEWFLQRSS